MFGKTLGMVGIFATIVCCAAPASLAEQNTAGYAKNIVIGEKSGQILDADKETMEGVAYINSPYFLFANERVDGIPIEGGASIASYPDGVSDLPMLLKKMNIKMDGEWVSIYGVWYCPKGNIDSPECMLLERPFAVNGKKVPR